jgi:4-hydroxy-2-oxoheptanedioate aldolase
MPGREVRQKLHEGRFVYATAVVAPTPYWPKLLHQAGADFVFIDSEHTPLGRETLSWMCHTYAGAGVPPVVRIPSPDPFEACKVLDGGAGGVIAPYVETPEQVRALVGAARYRPLKGQRLQEALRHPAALEPELRTYLEERNRDTILIVNIESVPAMQALDDICAVPGLDAVLIGPHDLSCSLGIPEQYGHPRFDEAVRTIFGVARKHGVGAGIHFWLDTELELAWARAGGNLVMHSSDLALFGRGLKADLAMLRSALEGTAAAKSSGAGDVV